MSNLYGAELARVFDIMYQGFIDYSEEFEFYATRAKKYDIQSILEIGCGTGNLAKFFIESFNSYMGLDLSEHMLQLAREKNLNGHFKLADMRSFFTDTKFEMAIIPGRSSSYLLSDTDLSNTFECISNALTSKGYLIFDCIDAEKFIPYVNENPLVDHNTTVENIKFSRSTHWHIENHKENLVNWKADYSKLEESKEINLGQDNVIFKAFTRKQIIEQLEKAEYTVISLEDRPSYAFDTFVVHAQKRR